MYKKVMTHKALFIAIENSLFENGRKMKLYHNGTSKHLNAEADVYHEINQLKILRNNRDKRWARIPSKSNYYYLPGSKLRTYQNFKTGDSSNKNWRDKQYVKKMLYDLATNYCVVLSGER